jgi:hypothetical protein
MAKGNIARLNETLNEIPEIARSYPRAFTNVSLTRLREILFGVLQDDPYIDRDEVSEDISLGGTRLIKFSSETRLRHTKRFLLLMHRIMGYHSSEQTRAYKAQILGLDEGRTVSELTLQMARGIRLLSDSLHDWLIKTTADDGGALVHYYNQGEDGRLNAMDITEDGWCLGVSVQWVRFRATGRNDFWQWLNSDEGAGACRFVMAAQGARFATGDDANIADRSKFALRRFGVIEEGVLLSAPEQVATPEAMARNINGGGHRLRVITVSYVDGGGHAMAADIGNSFTFMDPNAGEVRFTSAAQLESWLPKLVRKLGYHYSNHRVRVFSYQPALARQDQPRVETVDQTLRNAMAQRRAGMGY